MNCVGVAAECIVEVFELAVKDDPTNEEYLTHLFMGYVRVNDYKKQQQVRVMMGCVDGV